MSIGLSARRFSVVYLGAVVLACIQPLAALDYTIYADVADSDLQTLAFGIGDLEQALESGGHSVTVKNLSQLPNNPATSFVFARSNNSSVLNKLTAAGGILPGSLEADGFSTRTTRTGTSRSYWCFGDRSGLMYGALEFAELIKNDDLGTVSDKDHNPFMEKRGLKMNIPLDARTPSYADNATSAQKNIPEVWDMDFWHDQLDRMARNRYNAYTLWSLHPFPSLVKVDDSRFDSVALDDVMIADVDWADQNDHYDKSGSNNVNGDILNNLVTIKSMTIEQKIAFWQAVMEYARDRGIEFHFYTWNVFNFGAEDEVSLTAGGWDSKDTIDYYYLSMRALLETYPLLAGFGVTAGEHMDHAKNDNEEEEWLWDTYGKAVRDHLNNEDTEREFEFVHRIWWTDTEDIENNFGDLINHPRVKFNFSTKYAFARLYSYSTTDLHNKNKFGNEVDEIPAGSKFWLNLRNDDIFNFRWGDYDYVQEFMENTSPEGESWTEDDVRGFHMGSDGYVWGREFTDKNPEGSQRPLEHDKHWLKFMLWGRLGFDTNTPEERFAKEAERRLTITQTDLLMQTWKAASKIVPAVNRYHWNNWDFQWAVEYNSARHRPWHDLDHWAGKDDTTGDDAWDVVSDDIENNAEQVLNALAMLRSQSGNKDYDKTLNDLECFAHLGNFYAEWIRAAHYRDINNTSKTEEHSHAAASHWASYADLASSQYHDQILGRVLPMSWQDLYQDLLDDIPNGDKLNQLPTCAITSPSNGAQFFPAPADVSITVAASDPDGSIDRVELRVDGSLVDTTSSDPYTFTVNNLAIGTYVLEARAYDDEGASKTTSVTIDVVSGPGGDTESLPWLETFTFSNGTDVDTGATSWTATRSGGTFSVSSNRLMVNDGGSEAVLRTGWIDAAGSSLAVSLDLDWAGGLDTGEDYVQLLAIADGGSEILLDEVDAVPSSTILSGSVPAASLVQIVVRAYVSSDAEYYYLDNLSVTATGSPANQPPTLSFVTPNDGATYDLDDTIAIEVNATDSDGAIDRVELTRNGVAENTESRAPYTWSLSGLPAGTHEFMATAYDDDGASASSSITISVSGGTPGQTTYGNGGLPWLVPSSGTVRIEVENYDQGGSGVAYNDSTTGNKGGDYRSDDVDIRTNGDTDGTHYVGWTAGGEWLEFTIDVEAAGDYDLTLRTARRKNAGSVQILIDESMLVSDFALPHTGAWQTYASTTNTVTLAAGQQVLRIALPSGGTNLNWFELTAVGAPPTGNQPPTVTIITPIDSDIIIAGTDLVVEALASDEDGSVDHLDLFLNGTFVRTERRSRYQWGLASQNDNELQALPAGMYQLEVIAYDDENASGNDVINIEVLPSGGG